MDNKDFSIFNVNIQDTKFRVEDNATYCDLIVKVNLNSFEQQFFQFTPKFVKKVISEHLPVREPSPTIAIPTATQLWLSITSPLAVMPR